MTESNQPHEKRCETCDNWQFHRLNECEFIQARVSSDRKEFLEMVGCASHAASTSDNEQKEPQQELSIRSNKEIESLKAYITGLQKKLNNQNFIAKAASDVIEKEKSKLSEAEEKLDKLIKMS